MTKFDIIIIGAGPGGYETAVRAAKQGHQVAVVEARRVGGTCLNEGCIPTKCLCRTAEVLHDVKTADVFGVEADKTPAFSLKKAIERKDNVVETLVKGVEMLMRTPGITFFHGKATFVEATTMKVELHDGGEEILSAPVIIIATGSVSKFLPIEGAHSRDVLTSTEMLQLTELPRRLCIIGGGVIGLEFASIFNAFGSETTVVEYCKEVLPNLDADIAKRLRTSLKKQGIAFHVGAAVTAIKELSGGGSEVVFEAKGKQQCVEADIVLMAVGRAANVASLNLADVGIDFTPRGIKVDEHFATNIPGIYAIGDVNGICPLAHAAAFQGYSVLDHLFGTTKRPIDTSLVPSAVFTVPEMASVGLTEEACQAREMEYSVKKAFYRANGKSLSMGSDEGLVKLIVGTDDKLLGCHILGAHAADIVHEATLLMALGGTVADLSQTIHAHPTLSEVLLAAAAE